MKLLLDTREFWKKHQLSDSGRNSAVERMVFEFQENGESIKIGRYVVGHVNAARRVDDHLVELDVELYERVKEIQLADA